MTLRDDLQGVVDDSRQIVADLGLRAYVVKTRLRSWSGSAVGSGTATDADTTLSPPPSIEVPTARQVFDAPGKYEAGDVIVRKISRTYTEAQLAGAPTATQEWFWLVDSRLYRVVGVPEKRQGHAFEWFVHLRRITGR